jgi:hypothetical protein
MVNPRIADADSGSSVSCEVRDIEGKLDALWMTNQQMGFEIATLSSPMALQRQKMLSEHALDVEVQALFFMGYMFILYLVKGRP